MKKSFFCTMVLFLLAACSPLQNQKIDHASANGIQASKQSPSMDTSPETTSQPGNTEPLKLNLEGKETVKATEEGSNLTDNTAGHLQVTYIGNAGFMITTNHKKVIIDGLFRGFDGIYTLPEDIQNKLALAQPPFDNVDLILVTHNHRDHFSSGLVAQHLQNDPNTVLAALPSITGQFPNYADRLAAFDPTPEKPVEKDIDGIQVEALALTHGPGQPVNIGFVIEVEGFKLFFSGDVDLTYVSNEIFRAYHLPEKKLDIAFIQHFYLTDIPEEQQFIKQGIAAKYLIPTHYFYTTPPFNRETVKTFYPDAILFDKELSSWVMP